jgi:hypothetical protein
MSCHAPHLPLRLVSCDGCGCCNWAGARKLAPEAAAGPAAGHVHAIVGQRQRLADRVLHGVSALGAGLHLESAGRHKALLE